METEYNVPLNQKNAYLLVNNINLDFNITTLKDAARNLNEPF